LMVKKNKKTRQVIGKVIFISIDMENPLYVSNSMKRLFN
jgi:hypothetical protein